MRAWLARFSATVGLVVVGLVVLTVPAASQTRIVRIGETFGLTHLPSYIIADKQLIEKEAAARGLGAVKVELKQVGNGNIVSDLLLSGGVDLAMSGVVPFLTLWDKVPVSRRIRGIAALSECNVFLMTADPKIASLADFGPKDRIAMTDVKSTTWAILLQMAAEKEFGWDNRGRFESLSVPMANAEATAAMLSGRTEVLSHMTMLPFTAVERSTGKIKPILNSKDVLGGAYTATMAFMPEKFHDEHPQLYDAIAAAFEKAAEFINENPQEAAEIFQKHEPQKGGVASILRMMDRRQPDELVFTTTPHAIATFADFMQRTGLIKRRPGSWQDLFFENMRDKNGS
jgi:sulfonate transport system substrate-binding protein